MDIKFNPIKELIAEVAKGNMIVLLDDENRENEGDLVMAADKVDATDINFMARYARGLICLALHQSIADRLKLQKMVHDNQVKHGTNFTVSIEAKRGVSTGISAADRALTIQQAVHPESTEQDILSPGHIFPIAAREGGVLVRAGHTEAGCDIAELAGFQPASVIVEIMNDDGTMARCPDLLQFAQKHQLKIGTIKSLIQYKLEMGPIVQKVSEQMVKTQYGGFTLHCYHNSDCDFHSFALTKGKIKGADPVLVRVHTLNPLLDVFSIRSKGDSWGLQEAMAHIAKEGRGVVLLLDKRENLMTRLFKDAEQLNSLQEVQSNYDPLEVGVGAQIIKELGVQKLILLSHTKQFNLSGFGIEIVENICYG